MLYIVTLRIDVDPLECAPPNVWDWDSLLNDEDDLDVSTTPVAILSCVEYPLAKEKLS